jgi:hypothetical protein
MPAPLVGCPLLWTVVDTTLHVKSQEVIIQRARKRENIYIYIYIYSLRMEMLGMRIVLPSGARCMGDTAPLALQSTRQPSNQSYPITSIYLHTVG